MNRLRIVPLHDAVVLPGMPVTVTVDVGGDERVLLIPKKDQTYAKVGVVAEVTERMKVAGRGWAASLNGVQRATLGVASTDQDGVLRVDYESKPDLAPAPVGDA